MIFNSTIDWGSVPDWLAGVGTVGTLVFFGFQLRNEHRARRVDEERAREERRDREAAQARLIGTDFAWSYERDSGHDAKVYVTNHSNGPIFNLRACLQDSAGFGGQEPARLGPWSDQITMIDPAGWIEFLLVPSHQPPAPEDGTDATGYEAPKRMFTPRIEFTDADGLRWARVGNGQPHRSVAGSPGAPARRSPQSVRKAAEEHGQR